MITCIVLGSGGALPTPERAPAGYWLELDGLPVLLDPGPGALARAIGDRRGPGGVDGITTVLFSHLHVDHCADLVPLLFALHSTLPQATQPIQLIGPPGLAAYLRHLRQIYGEWIDPARRPVLVTETRPGDTLHPDPQRPGAWRVATAGAEGAGPAVAVFEANHSETRFSAVDLCFRLRDADGAVLAYSGDGEPGPGLASAARGADLLIVECSTPDELYTPGHMTPTSVGALCAEAQPRRVVLTHLYPPADALDLPALVRARFAGPVEKARDGSLYCVP